MVLIYRVPSHNSQVFEMKAHSLASVALQRRAAQCTNVNPKTLPLMALLLLHASIGIPPSEDVDEYCVVIYQHAF